MTRSDLQLFYVLANTAYQLCIIILRLKDAAASGSSFKNEIKFEV